MRHLFLGRFQPPHRGHLHALAASSRRADDVYVAVGSAQRSHEPHNPFTIGERFELLGASLDDAGLENVHLFPVPDVHRHAAWVAHVEALVPPFDVVVTNNPLTRRLFSAAGYAVHPGRLWRPDVCSGRRIRARWARGEAAAELLAPAVQARLARIQGPQRVRRLFEEATRTGRGDAR